MAPSFAIAFYVQSKAMTRSTANPFLFQCTSSDMLPTGCRRRIRYSTNREVVKACGVLCRVHQEPLLREPMRSALIGARAVRCL